MAHGHLHNSVLHERKVAESCQSEAIVTLSKSYSKGTSRLSRGLRGLGLGFGLGSVLIIGGIGALFVSKDDGQAFTNELDEVTSQHGD